MPSPFLYQPFSNAAMGKRKLLLQAEGGQEGDTSRAYLVQKAINNLIHSENYPCVPALLSLESGQYMVGLYNDFGAGSTASDLHKDLLYFREQQKKSKVQYLSFWAVFMHEPSLDESAFETQFWRELSHLCSQDGPYVPWDKKFSDDPADPNFCISVGSDAFFAVGLHDQSSRLARRFPWPAIVFNLYEQFEDLARAGRYDPIVRGNRAREYNFQGSLNPMVTKYSEQWESIQFSGKENSSDWKCPFHKLR